MTSQVCKDKFLILEPNQVSRLHRGGHLNKFAVKMITLFIVHESLGVVSQRETLTMMCM